MFSSVANPAVPYDQYLPLMSSETTEELLAIAHELRHLRIVHINSTATGGGVAEILQSLVPLMNGLGIATEWVVINPPLKFFKVTKQIHNLLQGAEGSLSPEDLEVYFQCLREVGEEMRRNQLTADVWFLHDPQLLPMARLLPRGSDETWIWVGHIDLTTPNPEVLDTLLPFTKDYDRLILSLDSYVPNGLPSDLDKMPGVYIAPPAIDPLTIKNIPLDRDKALELVAAMGVDPARPLVTQVSRFDLWKDPWGVIDAYRLARQSVPGLQLVLLGLSQAIDDPEALDVVTSVTEHAAQDPNIHIYFDPSGLPATINEVVNAFQVAADVVVQKSLREGFGLTVTEAMWKRQAVIGGNVGGICLQIKNGVNGYLVDSSEECARRIVELINDHDLRSRMGESARETVQERFLMPGLALDYLRVVKAHALRSLVPARGAEVCQRSQRFALA
jgi:trehalose synthase